MVHRTVARHTVGGLPDDEDYLRFVVELDDALGARDRGLVPAHHLVQLDEACGFIR